MNINILLLNDLHAKAQTLSARCDRITYSGREEVIWEGEAAKAREYPEEAVLIIRNFPECFNLHYRRDSYAVEKVSSVTGYTICLDDYDDVEAYIKDQFSRKQRGNLNRCIRRLETCYAIRYETYYGEIDRTLCAYLLEQLNGMVINRFRERKETSDTLSAWEQIQDTSYQFICEKKASLSVIYHESRPICISLCYHYGSYTFYYVTSYDLAFSKFSPGNIMIYKQLQWCITQGGVRFFDFGWGYLDYKRRWCNRTQKMQNHVVYHKKSASGFIRAKWVKTKIRMGNALRNLSGESGFKKFRLLKSRTNPEVQSPQFILGEITKEKPSGSFQVYPEEPHLSPGLEAAKNEFIYLTEEPFSAVKVYQRDLPDSLFIMGKKHLALLHFH